MMGGRRVRFLLVSLVVPLLGAVAWQSISGAGNVRVTTSGTSGVALDPAAVSDHEDCEPEAVVIDLGLEVVLYGGDTGSIVTLDEGMCTGTYELVMVSGDRHHKAGRQPKQTEERWLAEFVDNTGQTLATSPSTDDLPEDRTIGITTGTIDLVAGATGIRVRHAGPPNVGHSVAAVALALLPRSVDVDCDDRLSTVFFEGPPLTAGKTDTAKFDPSKTCLCTGQHVVAVSQDLGHRNGYQRKQTAEQWALKAGNTDGDVLGETESTRDLAEDRWASVDLLTLTADLTGGEVTLTATNTATEKPNSIDPIAVVIAAH